MEFECVGKCLLVKLKDIKILVVGDLHLGYEESMNHSGILVSREMFKEVREDFEKVFKKIERVDEIVLLGDVKHFFGSIAKQEWEDVLMLIDYLEEKCGRVVIVKGNHDMILEPIIRKRKVELMDFYILENVCFVHGNKEYREMNLRRVKYWVMGHGHPAVRISEPKGAKVEKYKCFLIGKFNKKEIIILPSFFAGNVGSDVREFDLGFPWNFNLDGFEVRIVGEELKVLDFGKLGRLG
jgi:uncharacterized protein